MSKPYERFDERGFPTRALAWDGTVPTVPTFPATQSGRRARGELEAICDMLCKKFMLDRDNSHEGLCSAEYLAHAAERHDNHPTTSAATARVLYKWQRVGYALIAEKPIRFVALTTEGVNKGFEELLRREKMAKRAWQAAVDRGEKPPVR